MNTSTARMVFWIAFLPVLAAELMRWTGGAYDHVTPAKLVGLMLIAVANGAGQGLLAVRNLRTEEKNPRDELPRRPSETNNPPAV